MTKNGNMNAANSAVLPVDVGGTLLYVRGLVRARVLLWAVGSVQFTNGLNTLQGGYSEFGDDGGKGLRCEQIRGD